MNNKTRMLCTFAIGVIVVIITVVIFFAGFSQGEKTTVDYTALLFELVSEIAFFAGVIFLINNESMDKTLIRAGLISTAILYWLVTTVIGLLSGIIFEENLGGFVTMQLIVMGVAAVVTICLFMAASSVQASNKEVERARLWLQEGENTVFALKGEAAFAAYSEQLEKLYEALRFSDKTAPDITKDIEINARVEILSSDLRKGVIEEADIYARINEIITLVKERNMLVLQSKRGGF